MAATLAVGAVTAYLIAGASLFSRAVPSAARSSDDERIAANSSSLAAAASPASSASPVSVVPNLTFATPEGCDGASCVVQLDVFVPGGNGPFPTVVLVRGGPSGSGGRIYMAPFAKQLAAAGILVFSADMRDDASKGGGYPAAFEDVACAVRYARASSVHYGGSGGAVTLVGHSLGGWVGSVVALDPAEFEGGCPADVSGRPDAFVGLSGNYDLTAPEVAGDLEEFFGGSADATADARHLADPFTYATGTKIPVRLLAGTSDTTVPPSAATALNAFLTGRGWSVTLILVPNGTHDSIISANQQGATSVGLVVEATQAAARCAASRTDC